MFQSERQIRGDCVRRLCMRGEEVFRSGAFVATFVAFEEIKDRFDQIKEHNIK